MAVVVHEVRPSSKPRLLVRLGECVLVLGEGAADAVHALEVRAALEPLLARKAAELAPDGSRLELLLAQMDAARPDPVAFLRCNWDLHRRVAALAGNPVLCGLYTELLDIVEERVEDVVAEPGFDRRSAASVAVHRDLVAAIAAGDVARVTGASRRHETLTAAVVVP